MPFGATSGEEPTVAKDPTAGTHSLFSVFISRALHEKRPAFRSPWLSRDISGRQGGKGRFSPESGNMESFPVRNPRAARRKKIESRRRMQIAHPVVDSESESSDCRGLVKRWRLERNRFYCGSSDGDLSSPLDGNVSLSLSSSSSSSDLEGNLTIGILASGGEVVGGDRGSIPCRSHGSVSVCGRRREMEDAVTVAPGFFRAKGGGSDILYDFFAVYDGHGGCSVAQACRDRLHGVLVKEMESRVGGEEFEWREVLEACFSKMDEEVKAEAETAGDAVAVSEAKTVGSTAVVALVGTANVIVANCGDSRAVLSRGGVALPLSFDHKPDRPDEMERVEAAGGRVINWDGCRVLGVLATSRSIGDHYLKPYVISKPEVVVMERTEMDEFLILASDGLWDVVSNEMACDFVRRCLSDQPLKGRAAEAAAVLVELAMGKGSKDNISVVVIELSKQDNCFF